MLKDVKDWKPPTPDHKEFKNFMIEQIESSTEYLKPYNHPMVSFDDWKKNKTKAATRDIKYHEEEYLKDIKSAQGKTKWIEELRNSLT